MRMAREKEVGVREEGELTLLSELGFALLHRSHDHVSCCGRGEAVEPGAETDNGDHVEVYRRTEGGG